jgi:chromosome segregation ATPase
VSDLNDLSHAPPVIIRRRWLPIAAIVLIFGATCVGVTGIYAGSWLTERKWTDKEKQWNADKLNYEQRLGTQSASFGQQLSLCQTTLKPLVGKLQETNERLQPLAQGLMQTQDDLRSLSERFTKATAQRDRVNNESLKALQETKEKTDALAVQLDRTQRTLIPKIDAAASAAQATEKKLDTATHSTAVVPAHPWAGGRSP